MTSIILKPNEIEDFSFGNRILLSVNAKKNDPNVSIPCEVFLFRQNTSPASKDGCLYGKGTVLGASRQDDGKWSFELVLKEPPKTPLYSEQLHRDVIDQNNPVEKEIAEVRRISWTRFFEISNDASDKLNIEHFGA